MRDALEIGIDRRIDARLDQIALLDQFGDLRAFDDGFEDAAEPAPVAAARRGGQAEQDRVRIGVDDLAIGLAGQWCASSIHQQIGGRQVHASRLDGAPMQGLDRCDLHAFERSRREAGLDDAVRNVLRRAAWRWSA